MARKPPAGGRPDRDAGAPSAVEVEAAIERALEALKPRAAGTRGDEGRKPAKRPARPRGERKE